MDKRFIFYKEQKTNKDNITINKDWQNRYYITANIPTPRELDKLIIIKKTSKNNYVLIISTETETKIENHKTLKNVNEALHKGKNNRLGAGIEEKFSHNGGI